jgi:hypothetical protein
MVTPMSNTNNHVPDDQLTPRDVIIKFIEIKNALLSNWKIIILLTAIGAGIGYVLDMVLKTPNEYEAEIVFNLGAGGSGGGGLGDLAGLVGLGSTPDANIFTGENFFYFVKSRPVMERTLMKEVEVNGQKMLLANLYIDSSGIRDKEWVDRPELLKFHFTTNDPLKMDRESRVTLNELVDKVQKSTEIGELDRKSSFIVLTASMENEKLTILWVNNLLETIEEVYTENQTKKTRKTLRLLENRADSLANILGNTEKKLARAVYESTQIIVPEAKIPATNLQRNSAFLQQLYYEAIGSVEKMRVSLVREAPLFTKIEDIKVPLDIKLQDKRRLKIGIVAGLLVSLIFVYFKSVFKSIPEETKAKEFKATKVTA